MNPSQQVNSSCYTTNFEPSKSVGYMGMAPINEKRTDSSNVQISTDKSPVTKT